MTNSLAVAVDPIDVSVILVCWNSLHLTSTAIQTLREHTTGVRYEIIVIDNGSVTDASATELGRFPDIRLILNPENLGFAAANNQGLAVAQGRHVLLLNSDTEQTENAIGRAVEYMDAHPQVGILGVMHRNGDPGRTFQQSAAPFPTPMAGCRRLLLGIFKKPRPLAPTEPPPERDVDWVTGSFLLARRACLDQVGPLDERFYVYAEDIDLCYQARKAGWKVRFWPGVSLVHLGSSSADQVADKTFMLYRNELEFFRKNQPPLATFAFYAVMTARLGFSTIYQAGRLVGGRARWSDVRVRWNRLWNFMTLRSDRSGLVRS
ncbi:MAG: glycosyltransferase family 2 protein [Planctomycetaceae bacterium]|nr:glycosyltransferase family 2 protein [Planctomycetaceae bacterium]MBV8308856.1 glycosyltransferase family 2 protein [Planctomycetaceae bacterium]